MDCFSAVRGEIIAILDGLVVEGVLPSDVPVDGVTCEPPRDSSHGDMATNAALVVSKKAGKNPREVAEMIARKLQALSSVSEVSVAGPGFINIRFDPAFWFEQLKTILAHEKGYGNLTVGAGQRVNVEYVSANPTGPMHIGHARGAVVGDALARLLQKAGYDVTKEYYVNDAGAQVDVLARSAYLRYREANGETIEIPDGYYPGEYLIAVGQALKEKHEDELMQVEESVWLPLVKPFALETMMTFIRQDLAHMGVEHDVFTSEAGLIAADKVEAGIAYLESMGLIYHGVLEPPKGKLPDDWEAREQLLFKSSEYGDDVDRALKKSDGSGTYFASDIAYQKDKLDRGFDWLIMSLGADHGGYVKRMKAAVSALSGKKVEIDIILHQLVNLLKNGEPFKMSKRAGNMVYASDVVEAVGKDALRFIMLTRKADAVLDFDLEKVKEQSKDNPVFYVQYAHARICSVLRHAAADSGMTLDKDAVDVSRLDDPIELAIIQKMAEWPRLVAQAAHSLEPHRLAFYVQELASDFHSLWNAGKDNTQLRFLVEGDKELTMARLALITGIRDVIASALLVMGVEPVNEM